MQNNFLQLLLCFSLLGWCGILSGQKVHLVLIGDTKDAKLGEGFARNMQMIEATFQRVAKRLDYDFFPIALSGSEVTTTKVQQLIECMEVLPAEDIIVFHYSGHGVNHKADRQWPALLIPTNEKQLGLLDIHENLKRKQARLLITVGDCCNYFPDAYLRSAHSTKIEAIAQCEERKGNELFSDRLNIILSASAPGQYAFTEVDLGGLLTNAFCAIVDYALEQEECTSWNNILQKATLRTEQYAKELDREQMPQYQIEIH